MRIAVAGSTGRTGRLILKQALARGHVVRALSRRQPSAPSAEQDLTWVIGDGGDVDGLKNLVAGCDVVISTIGPRKDDPRICSTATANLIAAGAKRLIVISGMGVTLPGDNKSIIDRAVSSVVRLLAPQVFDDKVAELNILRSSSVGWTAVRVGALRADGEISPVKADTHRPPGFAINTASLAAFCLSEAEQPRFLRQAPFVAF